MNIIQFLISLKCLLFCKFNFTAKLCTLCHRVTMGNPFDSMARRLSIHPYLTTLHSLSITVRFKTAQNTQKLLLSELCGFISRAMARRFLRQFRGWVRRRIPSPLTLLPRYPAVRSRELPDQ